MRELLTKWSLVLLCFSMGAAIGGGFYEHVILTPLWSRLPPASFWVIQPGTGVPLQTFWIPVHGAITLFGVLSLVLTWKEASVRNLLLVGTAAYVVMRVWSAVYFIPEMLAFQQFPLDAPASPELLARVERWTSWTWLREPLDITSMLCFLWALHREGRTAAAGAGERERRVEVEAPGRRAV